MKISRDVILDLLPLYVANEASADTRALVEEYLATDPHTADMARELARMEKAREIPAPLNREDAMEAYKEAKKLMFQKMLLWAIVVTVMVMTMVGFAAFFLFRLAA